MPTHICRRCRQPLRPVYTGQVEHPLCSPAAADWIPQAKSQQTSIPDDAPAGSRSLSLALHLAARGWHIFPLAPQSKQPLANCRTCRKPSSGHRIEDCPCLPAGCWCHGVRAATTNPDRIARWWKQAPHAVPGVAAGPSRLLLIDIDTHAEEPPTDPATELLPGIDLTTEHLPPERWRDRHFRNGRDTLTLLAQLRGGQNPWPGDPEHQPVVSATPSGGRHLWYQAPDGEMRQAIGALAWQVDIKAGWSYGLAPGATTPKGTYQHLAGNLQAPGRMPTWLAREVTRVATPQPRRPVVTQLPPRDNPESTPANYLTAVIDRGTARLARMSDGRQRALAALAYHAGGLLTWSGLDLHHVTDRLVDTGTASGLHHDLAHRIVRRSLARGIDEPLQPPSPRIGERNSA